MSRISRWDNIRINHFSYVNNLFITLNIGFIGFFVAQFDYPWNCTMGIILILSMISLMTSFITGIFTALNRLKDFRLTSKIVRLKGDDEEIFRKNNQNQSKVDFEINLLRFTSKKLGERSWCLFYFQIYSFLIGVFLGVLYLILSKFPI